MSTTEILPAAAETVAPPAHPLFVEFRELWKKAEALCDIEGGTTLMVRADDGILRATPSGKYPTNELLRYIEAGNVYILWGQKVLRGEFVDELN